MKILVSTEFRLMVQEKDCAPIPAGPRLGRLEPLPISKFTFDNRADATTAAAKLQAYVDTEHPKTAKK